jgi:hypothetical protein
MVELSSLSKSACIGLLGLMSLDLRSRPEAEERRWKLILELLEVDFWCFPGELTEFETKGNVGEELRGKVRLGGWVTPSDD